ncbi:MAG: hypothetical protein AB7F86_18430 [Bdellovibrionales bacterium]
MKQILLILSFTVFSLPALAGEASSMPVDWPAEWAELPMLETLDCRPRCDGSSYCGEIVDYDTCVSQPAEAQCYWTCDEN